MIYHIIITNLKMKFFMILCHTAAAIMDFGEYLPKWPEQENGEPIVLDPPLLKMAQDRGNVLVYFHAPWCGHCVTLEPEFAKASEMVSEAFLNATLATFDGSQHQDVTDKLNIRGFPTLRWYTPHGDTFDFDGPRKSSVIANWVRFMTIDPITDMVQLPTPESSGKKRVHVSLVAKERTPAFERIAQRYRTEAKWAFVEDDTRESRIIVHKPHEQASEMYDIDDTDKLNAFFLRERLPLFGELSQESFPQYKQEGKVGLVYILFKHDDRDDLIKQVGRAEKMVHKLANKWWEKFAFVFVNTVDHSETLKNWFNIEEFPATIVTSLDTSPDNSKRYILPGDFDFSAVNEFLVGIEDGTNRPHFKSEEVPEVNDQPVLKVVGKSILSEVFRPDRDFFLELYAPWCVHCHSVKPEVENAAQVIDEIGATELIRMGRMNGQANDSPSKHVSWEHFPSLMYFKAGSDQAILYEGERTSKAMLSFVAEHTEQKKLQKVICSLFAKNCVNKTEICGPTVCQKTVQKNAADEGDDDEVNHDEL